MSSQDFMKISLKKQQYDIAVVPTQTNDKYNPSASSSLKAFRYGKSSLGLFQISGDINTSTTYNGYNVAWFEKHLGTIPESPDPFIPFSTSD